MSFGNWKMIGSLIGAFRVYVKLFIDFDGMILHEEFGAKDESKDYSKTRILEVAGV